MARPPYWPAPRTPTSWTVSPKAWPRVPTAVDAGQLDLAVELLTDAAMQRGDDETTEALGSASPLGNLVSAIINPDADRLAPAPPFDDEVGAWSVLVDRFAATLDWDGDMS